MISREGLHVVRLAARESQKFPTRSPKALVIEFVPTAHRLMGMVSHDIHEVTMKVRCVDLALQGAMVVVGVLTTERMCYARSVAPGDSVVVSGPSAGPDPWELSSKSSLVLRDGAVAQYVNLYGSRLLVQDSSIESMRRSGVNATVHSHVDLIRSSAHGERGVGIELYGTSAADLVGGSSMNAVDSKVTGAVAGAVVATHSNLTARGSYIGSTANTGVGILLASGRVELAGNSIVEGGRAGVVIGSDSGLNGGDSQLVVTDGALVTSDIGPAVLVSGSGAKTFRSELQVRDRGTLVGGNGVAVEAKDHSDLRFRIEKAFVVGDILVSDDSAASIKLREGGFLDGSVVGPGVMSVGRNSVWTIPSNSRIRGLSMDGGTIRFAPGLDGARSLHVTGNVSGIAGGMVMNVHMDSGEASKSWADSVLVDGDVDVLRPVDVDVAFTGSAHGTDLNGDGKTSSAEGYSLVQVGGTSRPDAFRLRNQYVTFGAYQYELKAYAGEDVDQTQSQLNGGATSWDYRLAQRTVREPGGDEGAGAADDGASRPAVAPQVPSYLSAPAAAFAYADGMSTSLHERLGEIRDHAFEGSVGGEMFARYSGRSQRYSSDRAFKSYGYDFDENVEAWQFGGSIIGLDGDNGSLRAGVAIDHGRSTIVPRAMDGDSVTRLRVNGASAWVTWRNGNGFWTDWVVGQERMRGQTDTSLGGRGVGRVKATSTGISFAAGFPFRVATGWSIEPHLLVATQGLRFDPIRDQSGLDVKFGRGRYVTKTAGLSLFRHSEIMAPFVRLDVRSTSGRGVIRTSAGSNSAATDFDGGRAGADYTLAGGLTTQLSARVQAFGEGAYRHYLGQGGFQGWSGNLGIRIAL